MNVEEIRALNETAAFNRWCGFKVASAANGRAVLEMEWHDGLGQYTGFLHAGVVSALVDTACGFAAASIVGRVLAAHCAVSYVRPATGRRFIARAIVEKPGRTTLFTRCELYAVNEDAERLVATGATILCAG